MEAQQITPTVPPPDVEQKPVSSNRKTKILLLVFLFLLLAATLVFGYQLTQQKPQDDLLVPPVEPNPTEVIESEWKTYKNEEFGFEFQYPSDWKVSEPPQNPGILYVKIQPSSTEKISLDIMTGGLAAFGLQGSIQTPFNMSFLNENIEVTEHFVAEHTENQALKLFFHNFKYENKDYQFYYSTNSPLTTGGSVEEYDQYKQVALKILSSFRFVEVESSDISDWKTYTNTTYHYSFKYPDTWGKGATCDGDAEKDLQRFGSQLDEYPYSNCGTANLPSSVMFYVEKEYRQPEGYEILEEKALMFGSKKSTYYIYRNIAPQNGGPNEYARVVMPLQNENQLIGTTYDSANNEIFEKILSTFKFSD